MPTEPESLAIIDTTLVEDLPEAMLDALPHGAIQLDLTGKILKFNAYESNLAQLPKQGAVGRNFFTEIAPCTDVQEFHGRFLEGVQAKKLSARFRFHFAFKQNPPQCRGDPLLQREQPDRLGVRPTGLRSPPTAAVDLRP